MSLRQRTMWEQTVRVLNRNSIAATIAVEPPRGRSRHSQRLMSGLSRRQERSPERAPHIEHLQTSPGPVA